MAKIKKEELEKVQELNSKLGSIKMALGDAYIVKKNVDNRLEQLPKEFQEVQSDFDEFTKSLEETYGNVQIDIKTGEITEPSSPIEEVNDNKGDA